MSATPWRGLWYGQRPAGEPHVRARRIVRSTGGIVRGKFPSRKNGRMVHHEGLLELDAIYLFEASPQISTYREQPLTIRYPDGPRLRRYTPDFELTLSNGDCVLVEVKPLIGLADKAVRHKLDRVRMHLQRSDQCFLILDDSTLRMEPRQANLRQIYHCAPRIRQPISAYKAALDRHAFRFPLPISSATTLFLDRGVEPYSMLLAGLLRCDLDQPILPETPLHITKEGDDAWFRIAPRHDF